MGGIKTKNHLMYCPFKEETVLYLLCRSVRAMASLTVSFPSIEKPFWEFHRNAVMLLNLTKVHKDDKKPSFQMILLFFYCCRNWSAPTSPAGLSRSILIGWESSTLISCSPYRYSLVVVVVVIGFCFCCFCCFCSFLLLLLLLFLLLLLLFF